MEEQKYKKIISSFLFINAILASSCKKLTAILHEPVEKALVNTFHVYSIFSAF